MGNRQQGNGAGAASRRRGEGAGVGEVLAAGLPRWWLVGGAVEGGRRRPSLRKESSVGAWARDRTKEKSRPHARDDDMQLPAAAEQERAAAAYKDSFVSFTMQWADGPSSALGLWKNSRAHWAAASFRSVFRFLLREMTTTELIKQADIGL